MQNTTRTHKSDTFTRRIGNTTYRVGVHFSRSNRETAKEKIARLVRMENHSTKVGKKH